MRNNNVLATLWHFRCMPASHVLKSAYSLIFYSYHMEVIRLGKPNFDCCRVLWPPSNTELPLKRMFCLNISKQNRRDFCVQHNKLTVEYPLVLNHRLFSINCSEPESHFIGFRGCAGTSFIKLLDCLCTTCCFNFWACRAGFSHTNNLICRLNLLF